MNLFLFFLSFFFLLFLGIPIGFTMLISAVVYLFSSGNLGQIMILSETLFSGLNSYILCAIPLFMVAGDLMNRSGISNRLISFSNLIVGRIRGGLAQVNVLASILFAGITGVALGDIAALGTIFLPEMRKQGYEDRFTAAVTAASSLLGPIIPPSTIIVLYSAIMGESVGSMFIGAIIPGLLIGLSDMIIVYIVSRKRNYPTYKVKLTPKVMAESSASALLALVMPVIIVGGILGGIFTPTEAASVSVVYALFIGFFVYRSLKGKDLLYAIKDSAYQSGKILIIIAGASLVSWIFGIEGVGNSIEELALGLSSNRLFIVFAINLFFLFMGTWMDPGASMILFAPLLAQTAFSAGLHPVQYGIMIIIISNIGFCTPPVGNVLYAISDMAKVDIFSVAKELLPFIVINLFIVTLIGIIPEITLILPRLMGLL